MTIESFLSWKADFDEERLRNKDKVIKGSKLTGYIFIIYKIRFLKSSSLHLMRKKGAPLVDGNDHRRSNFCSPALDYAYSFG